MYMVIAGIMLGMGSANERRRYIGYAHIQNSPGIAVEFSTWNIRNNMGLWDATVWPFYASQSTITEPLRIQGDRWANV